MSTVCGSRQGNIYCRNSDWMQLTRTINHLHWFPGVREALLHFDIPESTLLQSINNDRGSNTLFALPGCVVAVDACFVFHLPFFHQNFVQFTSGNSYKSTFTQSQFLLSHKCPPSHHCHYCYYYQNQHHHFYNNNYMYGNCYLCCENHHLCHLCVYVSEMKQSSLFLLLITIQHYFHENAMGNFICNMSCLI